MHPSHGGFILVLVDPGKFFSIYLTGLRPPRVSPLDRWLCVLPIWQLNVNVNVRFVLVMTRAENGLSS